MRRLVCAVLLGCALCGAGWAQQIVLGERPREQVVFLGEPKMIAANRTQPVELHFQVLDGFHINSHTPAGDALIATELRLEPAAGVVVGQISYPAGHAYSFSFDPKMKLDVYSGDVRVSVPVTATAGMHELRGTLRYQACDNAMCYPPRDVAVRVELVAR